MLGLQSSSHVEWLEGNTILWTYAKPQASESMVLRLED